jgi:hypothetical protein
MQITHHHLPVNGNGRGRHAPGDGEARGHLPPASALGTGPLLHLDGAAVDSSIFQAGAAVPHARIVRYLQYWSVGEFAALLLQSGLCYCMYLYLGMAIPPDRK